MSSLPTNPLLLAALRSPAGQLELRLRLAQAKEERDQLLAIIADDRNSPLDRVLAATAVGAITPQRAEQLIEQRPGMIEAAAALGDIVQASGQGAVAVHAGAGAVVTINVYATNEVRV